VPYTVCECHVNINVLVLKVVLLLLKVFLMDSTSQAIDLYPDSHDFLGPWMAFKEGTSPRLGKNTFHTRAWIKAYSLKTYTNLLVSTYHENSLIIPDESSSLLLDRWQSIRYGSMVVGILRYHLWPHSKAAAIDVERPYLRIIILWLTQFVPWSLPLIC